MVYGFMWFIVYIWFIYDSIWFTYGLWSSIQDMYGSLWITMFVSRDIHVDIYRRPSQSRDCTGDSPKHVG